MAKSAIVILADGFEEIEAITPIDILRRAGVETTVAGLGGVSAVGSHGVSFLCDSKLDDLADQVFDAVVLPGGMPGAESLGLSPTVERLCRKQAERGGIVAALCAAPAMALARFGLLDGKRATCYPGFEKHFSPSITHVSSEAVVIDGNIVTSRGPGTAFAFGLALAELLAGKREAEQLARAMQYTR